MKRRAYLAALGTVGAGGLAGCTGLVETRSLATSPPVLENRPAAVYFPTHVEGMAMAGMAMAGEYRFAVTYSYPHRFWNVNGTDVSMTDIENGDEVHLMSTVWDPETGVVLPDTGLTVEISKGGELVSQEVIYPMLSQPMGFHYGANFSLDGDGEYTVTVSVGGMSTRRTGAFAGRFGEPASADVPFEYQRSRRDEIMFERTMDRAGERAARPPMEMGMMPISQLPPAEAMPGTYHATAETGDAHLVVTSHGTPPEGVEGEGAYLAVSARTPYNRMVIPAMGLSGTLSRDGETVYEGPLTATLDPEVGYHYGAAVPSVEAGDALELEVTVPPQVARHEGYETAFIDMPPVEVTL